MMRYIKDDKRAHRRSLPNSGRVGPPSSLYTPPPAGSHPRFHRMSFQYIYTIQLVLYTYTNAILGLRFQIMIFQSRVNSLMSPYTTLVPPKISQNGLSTNKYASIHILYVCILRTPPRGYELIILIKERTSSELTSRQCRGIQRDKLTL